MFGPLMASTCRRIDPAAAAFLREAAARAGAEGLASAAFASAWGRAGRRLGRAALAFDADETAELARAGAPFAPAGWAADEAGRALLLLAALAGTEPEARAPALRELYRTGEVRERQALVRVLAFIPDPPGPAALADLAEEVARTHMLSVFEALACENPYPARHLADAAFGQIVVKALSNGIALSRIAGLASRRGPELSRMVQAFASERLAAGRPLPPDLELAC
jgi:hypothetical protein